MNRDSFMNELEALLQDISAEERAEALLYYSDYFADAGIENESSVIEELGSPRKVAETIKAGLAGNDGEHQEYRETGYTDTRFETKDAPERRSAYSSGTGYHPEGNAKKMTGGGAAKLLLILGIILVGIPIVLPLGCAVIAVILSLIVAFLAVLLAILLACVGVAAAGAVLFLAGVLKIVTGIATAMMLMGSGLILGVLGVVGTVLMAKVSWIAVTGMFRGLVMIVRKPFHRKAV